MAAKGPPEAASGGSDTATMLLYDARFFEYLAQGSLASARHIVPIMTKHLPISSVLDVGCGQGAWLSVWREAGVSDAFGVDGAHVNTDALLIPQDMFKSHDLARTLDLGRRFDVVQCLEVAEHIPETRADALVDSLTAHGRIVLFSAASPGQGGVLHINEQPFEYWSEKFATRGFQRFDFVRPKVFENSAVEPWFRYNTFIFASDAIAGTLPDAIRSTRVPRGTKAKAFGDWRWRLRCMLLAPLPPRLVTWLSRLHYRLTLALSPSPEGQSPTRSGS